MTRTDPKRVFLRALARELRWHPITRRRLLNELAQHLDDSAADLQAAGLSPEAALREALRRLGDVQTIATALRSADAGSRWEMRARRLRSPAWVAAGAMALATTWAAELPQASPAKATTSASPVHRVVRHRTADRNGRAPSIILSKRHR